MNQADCPYTLSRAAAGEAPAFYALMRSVYEGMPDKDLFAVGEIAPEWMQKALTPPCFGIGARTASGELAGMLVVVTPEGWEHSLARKAGLSPDQLPLTMEMDMSCVAPQHRGHGLQQRMLAFAEELLPREARFLLCTVSPHNPASLASVRALGYRVAATREMYGGFLRHILIKDRSL